MPLLSETMVLPLALAILAALGLGLWTDRREILNAARSEAALRWQAVEFWRGEAVRFADKPKSHKSALVQLQLAIALNEAGLRHSDRDLLEEARAAANAAEGFFNPKKNPAESMGAGLMIAGTTWQLGARDWDVRRLEEAERKFREVLQNYGDKIPAVSVSISSDLGAVLACIGMCTGDAARLEEAVKVCRRAVESPDCKPNSPGWASSHVNLGDALRMLGEHRQDPAPMREAISLLEATLAALDREKAPLEWGVAQCNLGSSHLALGELTAEPRNLKAAVAAIRHAVQVCTGENEPVIWAGRMDDLARALALLGERKGDRDYLDKAHAAVRAALEIVTRDGFPVAWAETNVTLGRLLEARGRLDNDITLLERAAKAYGAALEVFEPVGPSHCCERARKGLERVRGALSKAGALQDQGPVIRPTLDPDFA